MPSTCRRALVLLFSMAPAFAALTVRAQAPAPVSGAPPASGAAPKPAAKPSAEAPPETPWPYVLKSGTTMITVFQPQLDVWDGFKLQVRAAVSVAEGEKGTPVYGIVHAETRTLVDKDRRTVHLEQYKLLKADFPSAPERAGAWLDTLQKDASTKRKTIALDRLEAAVRTLEMKEKAGVQSFKNEPPRFIFSTVKAMLVYVDGEPAYRPVPGTKIERVINTRPLLVKDEHGKHYLHVFDGWMVADSFAGHYAPDNKPPQDLEKVKKMAVESRQVDLLTGQTSENDPPPSLKRGPVPTIHVATTPTELFVTDGESKWVPLAGTNLLYVENTTGHVFKETTDQKTYVLASGRWFRAPDEKGPWEFVPADMLPPDYAKIPDDSPKENVKASVAGTPQAEEAAIAAEIPQTAAVKRSEVKMTAPNFDGEPQLRAIETTPLQYVVNSRAPILMVDPKGFYAVENGVWFVATSVKGPWMVATSVPAVIYSIPASSPLHYVTYVRVYDSNADTVYVGYTPGYKGECVDHTTNVVIYGTGYPYPPWVGTVWYGPPVTYGFGVAVRYTPWTGWGVGYGFGWSWGSATVAVGWGWGSYPWWGPYGWGYSWGPPIYASPYYWGGAAYGYRGGAVAWGPGGWAGTTGNIYSQWGPRSTVSRYSGGYNAWTGNAWASRVGTSYNSRTGVASAGQRGAVQNVYTGNYATGGRGVAQGPGGTTAVGRGGTVGNVHTGREVSAGQAAVYNPRTGEGTTVGGIKGNQGGAVRVGDDVYAGRDGNVYRHTDGGWQQHNSGSGWSNVERSTTMDREWSSRAAGQARAQTYGNSTRSMNRSYGGARGGGSRRR